MSRTEAVTVVGGGMRLVRRHAPAWVAKGARILSPSPGIIDTGMGRLEADSLPTPRRRRSSEDPPE